jgi:hypothetical protein
MILYRGSSSVRFAVETEMGTMPAAFPPRPVVGRDQSDPYRVDAKL